MQVRFWLAVVLSLAARATAQVDAGVAPGRVDWTTGQVRATGGGPPDFKALNPAQVRSGAERLARAEAEKRLLEQVQALPLDGTRELRELLARDDARRRVEALVRGAAVSSKRYFTDGGVVVELGLPLAALNDVIDPEAAPKRQVGGPDGDATFSGLIVDARGLKARPLLAPRVTAEGGVVLYSLDTLSREARGRVAVAEWVRKLEAAKASRRAGDKPLVVKPTAIEGPDFRLSADDAKRLAALEAGFLSDGRVVIVYD
jgi:hypothetical protein